jgi:hypothetical protein
MLRARIVPVTIVVALLCACGDGLLKPSGSDSTGFLPMPGPNFLDDRLAGCPTAAELATVSDNKMIFDTTTLTGPLVCREAEGSADLTYPRLRVYWSLILMKELKFDAPLPWTSKPLYDWYRDAINGVRVIAESGTSNCCGPDRVAIMYVNATGSLPLKWPTLQQFIGLLAHEVRHAEVGGHPCGQFDNRVSDMGAGGVQNLFFTWIGAHSNPAVIPVEYRPIALHDACIHRGNSFCLEPHQTCS